MLSEAPSTQFQGVCDRCGALHKFKAPDLDMARLTLRVLGWREAGRQGRARELWLWWCPPCVPKTQSPRLP